MAWEHPARRDRVLDGAEFQRFRDKTITERGAFLAELAQVKTQGFGEDREEFDDHIRCIGVPIFDRLGQPDGGHERCPSPPSATTPPRRPRW